MTKIQRFESFNSDTLYIFDFDETLVKTPTFEELAIQFLKEDITIEDMLKKSVDKIGVNLSDIKWENGRLYVNDPNFKINVDGNWIRKNNRVYLLTPNRFPFTNISLPRELKELSDLYNNTKEKCIVTARPEDMRSKIISTMEKLGLKQPKHGLHMFPGGKGSGNAGVWKGHKIVDILEETGFMKAHFYDDSSKIINRTVRTVNQKLPKVEFKVTKVK